MSGRPPEKSSGETGRMDIRGESLQLFISVPSRIIAGNNRICVSFPAALNLMSTVAFPFFPKRGGSVLPAITYLHLFLVIIDNDEAKTNRSSKLRTVRHQAEKKVRGSFVLFTRRVPWGNSTFRQGFSPPPVFRVCTFKENASIRRFVEIRASKLGQI